MSRAPLGAVLVLVLAAAPVPGVRAAGEPASRAEEFARLGARLREERAALADAAAALKAGRARGDVPGTLSRTFAALPAELDRYAALRAELSPGSNASTAEAKAAAAAAAQAQSPYWRAHPDWGGPTTLPGSAPASELPERVEEAARRLAALVGSGAPGAGGPVVGRRDAPAADRGAAARRAGGVLSCGKAFDGAACGAATAAPGAAPAAAAPARAALTATVNAPLSGGRAALDRGAVPTPPSPASRSCAAAVNGPDAARPQHPTIAGWCAKAPEALKWGPPMLAGMLDALKESFGTVKGIATQIGFFILGLMATVATGALGVILKLVALIGAGWAIGRLLWDLQKRVREALSAPPGSVQRYAAFRALGATLTNLAVLVVMVLAGVKYGKSAGMRSMETGVAKAMNSVGLKAAAPAPAAAAGAGAAARGGLKEMAAEVLGPEKPVEAAPPEPLAAAEPAPKPAPAKAVTPPEPPPPPPAPKPLEWVTRASEMDAGMVSRLKANPSSSIFRSFLKGTLQEIKGASGRTAYMRGDASEIAAAQGSVKGALMQGELRALREAGLKPGDVISHGTNMKGLLGMLMKGEILSTNRQTGISGESANIWGASGLDAGAGYGATTGVRTGQPGVAVLMRAAPDLKVVAGETLSRTPTVEGDFLAVVVSDGSRTVVLGRETLRALAASAKAWAQEAKAAAYAGDMRPFNEWERVDAHLAPK